MPLPWQHTFYHCQKRCLAHLHPKANICAKFHENWWKTEEVVRDARFFPHFCHNMPLPWQHSFCHCRKMCLAHLHSKANISAKFHENWSKTEEVVRDARLATARPPDQIGDRPPDQRHADSYIPPLYTTCMRYRVCGGIKTKKYKELGPAKLPCYKRVLLYPTSLYWGSTVLAKTSRRG